MIQPNNDPFTPSEVRALIEDFRFQLSVFGEDLLAVRKDVSILKDDVRGLKEDMISVKDVIRISIPDLYTRVKALEDSRKN